MEPGQRDQPLASGVADVGATGSSHMPHNGHSVGPVPVWSGCIGQANVIAAGAATAGQTRTTLGSRPVCGGNNTAANYIDATDVALTVTLNVAQLTARCP